MAGYTHGKKNIMPDTRGMNMLQRVWALEQFSAGLVTFLHDTQAKKVERSAVKIEKMKIDLKDSIRKRSLRKFKPIKRPRKIK